MPIVVFQHSDLCRPGRLGKILRDHAFRLDIRRPDKGDPFPPDLDDVEGVVSLGGPQHVGGREPWLAREIDFLKAAHDASLPVVGVCLGHQLIAKALGGEVGPMDKPEVGMVEVDLTPAGQTDPILAGVAWRSWQFALHNDEVKAPPPGATLLASSASCKVQAFKAGMRTYAFQFHLECDRPLMDDLLQGSKEECARAGLRREQVLRDAELKYEMFARLADRVCENIALLLIPKVATAVG